jgi:hypothetical protein
MGRKRKTSVRTAANLRAARKLGTLTKEEIAARKEAARTQRAAEKSKQKEIQRAQYVLAQALKHADKEVKLKWARAIIAEGRTAGDPQPAAGSPAPVLDTTLNPYAADLEYTRVDHTTGHVTHVRLPLPDPKPTPVAAPIELQPGRPVNPLMPVWIQQGRSATRDEWLAHQHDRYDESKGTRHATIDTDGYNGVGGVSLPNGVYLPPTPADHRDAWRYDGSPNWTKKL